MMERELTGEVAGAGSSAKHGSSKTSGSSKGRSTSRNMSIWVSMYDMYVHALCSNTQPIPFNHIRHLFICTEGQESNTRIRRKSLTNSTIQPISEDGGSGSGSMFSTNKDLEGMLHQPSKSKPAGAAESAPHSNAIISAGDNTNLNKPQRKRGSAASFIINNTNNGLHLNNIDQVERIVSHVQVCTACICKD
ncbi:hypothetical protein EON65_56475 [archaeon]|nr:MAG: hypothetical protein EON65_56475 [archaeon]